MALVKNLDVVLRAKNDRLQKDLNKANKMLSQSLRKMARQSRSGGGGGRGAFSGGFIGGIFGGAGAAVALRQIDRLKSTLTGLTQKAIGLAAGYEKAGVSFEVLTGNAKTGQDVLANLQNFAATTPFKQDEVIAAGRQLLAARVPVEQLADRLQLIGDAAAGSGARLTEVTAVLAKIRNSGKLTGETFLQLAERSINLAPVMQEMFGNINSGDDFKNAVSQGAISFEMVVEALRKMNSEGGMFFGGMQKLSQTLDGLLSTLSDKWDILLRKLAEKLLPGLKSAVMTTIDWLDNIDLTSGVWADISNAILKVNDYLTISGDLASIFGKAMLDTYNTIADTVNELVTLGGILETGTLAQFFGLDRFGADLDAIVRERRRQAELQKIIRELKGESDKSDTAVRRAGVGGVADPVFKSGSKESKGLRDLASAGLGTQAAFAFLYGRRETDEMQIWREMLREQKRQTELIERGQQRDRGLQNPRVQGALGG